MLYNIQLSDIYFIHFIHLISHYSVVRNAVVWPHKSVLLLFLSSLLSRARFGPRGMRWQTSEKVILHECSETTSLEADVIHISGPAVCICAEMV